MRQLIIIFGIAIAVIAIVFETRTAAAKEHLKKTPQTVSEQEKKDFNKTKKLLSQDEPEDALVIIRRYKPKIEALTPQGLKWMELFIEGSVDTQDKKQLAALYEFFPEIFKEHEKASLLAADEYILTNNPKNYDKIRSLWEDRETKVAAWSLLDTERLLLDGKKNEAIEKLKSRSFNSKADIGRLVHLALLHADDDQKKAWTYLAEAYAKDPRNPDIRLYRAKLLESAGKNKLAVEEYEAATQIAPSNLFLKNQLIEFYLRHGQYQTALNLLKKNLSPPSLDTLWIEAIFWNKMTTPIDYDWKKTPIPDGKLNRFIRYLIALKPDQFWDQSAFKRIPYADDYLKTRQETFWLRLVQAFKDNNINEAEKLLRYNPFAATSWHPQLETALKRVLNFRKNHTLKLEPGLLSSEKQFADLPKTTEPSFFKELAKFSESEEEVPHSIRQLLLGKEAFSAIFLAAGWTEAGLQLNVLPVMPDDYPNWVALDAARAFYNNRSNLKALEFASMQKQTPELKLLTAELTIAGGDSDKALNELLFLARDDSETGYRAAWLASLLYLEKKDYDHARTAINSQPRLVYDTLGQETLARIAYLEGNKQLAGRLYRSIESKSPEARSYLARQAFLDKDWDRAKKLTEQLIIDYPKNSVLKENLKKIIERQQKSRKTPKA